MEENSTSRLTLRMCHGCVYTGNFVSDYHALFLQHRRHVYRIKNLISRAFPERVGPRPLLLESVGYFGTTDFFNGRNKEQSSRFTEKPGWRMEDGGSGIENRGSRIG